MAKYKFTLNPGYPKNNWGMVSDHRTYDYTVRDEADKPVGGVCVSVAVSVEENGATRLRTEAEIEACVKAAADAQLLLDLRAAKRPSAKDAPNPVGLASFTGQDIDPDKAVGPMGEAIPK